MHSIKYLVPCEYGMVDRSGKISAINIFDGIYMESATKPRIMTLYIAGEIVVDSSVDINNGLEVTLSVISPSGKTVGREKLKGPIPPLVDGKRQINVVARFTLIKFDEPGVHKITALINNMSINGDWSFDATVKS